MLCISQYHLGRCGKYPQISTLGAVLRVNSKCVLSSPDPGDVHGFSAEESSENFLTGAGAFDCLVHVMVGISCLIKSLCCTN